MPNLVPLSPRSAYSPVRFQMTHPWWKEMGPLGARFGDLPLEQQKIYFGKTFRPALEKAMLTRMGVRPGPALIQNELGILQIFGDFLQSGRPIFDIPASLSSVFASAPFDDVAIGDLNPIEGCQYFHYGPVPELVVNGVQYEGAFLEWDSKKHFLSIHGTREGAFAKKAYRFYEEDDLESLCIEVINPTESISSAIENSNRRSREKNAEMLRGLDRAIEQLTKVYGGVNIDQRTVEKMRTSVNEPFREVMIPIVLGTLAFLVGYPDDREAGWPSDIPDERLIKVSASNIGKAATAQKALDNEGYYRINYIGQSFLNSTPDHHSRHSDGTQGATTGRKRSTHVRNFHWRRQACGPQWSQHVPRLIPRTIINPGGALPAGKIYEVKDMDSEL